MSRKHKAKVNGKWVFSNGFIKYKDGTIIVVTDENDGKVVTCPIDEGTLCLHAFTNKKGCDYYENDIIKHNKNSYFIRLSVNQHVLLLRDMNEKSKTWKDLMWLDRVQKYVIVLGNLKD